MERKIPTALRVLGWIALFGLLAGLLSCGLAYAVINRLFVPWRALPALPEPAYTIRGATIQTVDVETTGGRLLRYDLLNEMGGWQEVNAPRHETDSNCARFPRAARPPGDALELRLVCRNYVDGGVTTRYALLRDGRVMAWNAADYGVETMFLFLFPAAGAPLGMLLGLIFGLSRSRREQQMTV